MWGWKKKFKKIEAEYNAATQLLSEMTQELETLKGNDKINNDEIVALRGMLKKSEDDDVVLHGSIDGRLNTLEAVMSDYFAYLKRKASEEPFIEVLSESFDEETGIQIKLDWNDAMINYLKRNGYRGVTDDEIVEKYVSDVFNDRAKNGPEPIT